MTPGYIYILLNKAYGPYVVKIGLTTRQPNVRAREISGSTGVPIPFDIAVAYTVGDCKLAEKRIHKRLRAYRLNGRREFFRISPEVAAEVAQETCASLNNELGLSPPEELTFPQSDEFPRFPGAVHAEKADPSDPRLVQWFSPGSLRQNPVGTCTLSEEQFDRAKILHMNLRKATGIEDTEWMESFTRDVEPERELKIWENIAVAYLTVDGIDVAPEGFKKEAYRLLLQRSWSSTDQVLASATLEHLSLVVARKLLDRYLLRPKPLLGLRAISLR